MAREYDTVRDRVVDAAERDARAGRRADDSIVEWVATDNGRYARFHSDAMADLVQAYRDAYTAVVERRETPDGV